MGKIIINADDFGISKGVNEAIVEMHKKGNLTSASLMVKAKYTLDAVQKSKENPNLEVGLHFNLTTGRSVLCPISIPLLVDESGVFKNGFLKLLWLSIFCRKAFISQADAELKAQISMLKAFKITPSHIDGHRHIHYILGIFNIVQKVAEREQISRVRIINESLLHTIKMGFIPPISGLIKWFILRFLGFLNGARKVKKAPYFFSIIHSCRITNEMGEKFKLLPYFDAVEFMVHPSIKELDLKDQIEYEKPHLISKYRKKELQFKIPKL